MYTDHLRIDIDPRPCALWFLVDVFPCVVSLFTLTIRDCFSFLSFFELSYLLIAIRLSPHHLPLAVGMFAIFLCRFFTLSIVSLFETTQKHIFFHSMPPKSPYLLLTSLPTPPVLSPPCRPYLSPGFYVTYICSFAGDVLSNLSPTRMRFVLRLSFSYRSHEPCATVTMDNNYGPMVPKAL